MSNDLSEQNLHAIYSDMHKDAYGHRPRNGGVHDPVTLEDFDAAFEAMGKIIAEEQKREDAISVSAIKVLETELKTLQDDHTIDRTTALRWWFEAQGCENSQDREHALWNRGIAIREWVNYDCAPY